MMKKSDAQGIGVPNLWEEADNRQITRISLHIRCIVRHMYDDKIETDTLTDIEQKIKSDKELLTV